MLKNLIITLAAALTAATAAAQAPADWANFGRFEKENAALAEHPVPLIIVDMGTATTVCVINSKRQYIGGMIVPGVRTALDSLVSHTSLLQQISLEPPKKVIGSNTIDGMKSGMIYGNASILDGLIDRIEEELGEKCTIVATGGLAGAIVPHCRRHILVDDDLLLKGLKIIYEKNR